MYDIFYIILSRPKQYKSLAYFYMFIIISKVFQICNLNVEFVIACSVQSIQNIDGQSTNQITPSNKIKLAVIFFKFKPLQRTILLELPKIHAKAEHERLKDESCVVCLADFNTRDLIDQNVVALKCSGKSLYNIKLVLINLFSHYYHEDCLYHWLLR